VLQHLAQSQDQRKTASALEPCTQLEFQSTADLCFLRCVAPCLDRAST
jgi:hypothetical protein